MDTRDAAIGSPARNEKPRFQEGGSSASGRGQQGAGPRELLGSLISDKKDRPGAYGEMLLLLLLSRFSRVQLCATP